jgi:hypothetical protein
MATRGLSHLPVANDKAPQALNREIIPYIRELGADVTALGLRLDDLTALLGGIIAGGGGGVPDDDTEILERLDQMIALLTTIEGNQDDPPTGSMPGDVAAIRAAAETGYVELALSSQSGLASWTSEWIDTRRYRFLLLLFSWSAAAGTAGTLGLEGTLDPAKAAQNIHDISSIVTVYYGTWPTVAASAGACTIPLDKVFPYLRLKYTRAAGGAAGQFSPYAFGRVE